MVVNVILALILVGAIVAGGIYLNKYFDRKRNEAEAQNEVVEPFHIPNPVVAEPEPEVEPEVEIEPVVEELKVAKPAKKAPAKKTAAKKTAKKANIKIAK